MLLALLIPSQASQQLTGDYIQAAYDDEGVWNDTDSLGEGLEFDSTGAGTSFCDFTYPGTPWTHVEAEWDQSGSSEDYYVNSTYGATATAVSETDASTSSEMVSIHAWTMGDLSVTKVEIWEVSGTVISINYVVTNDGTDDATDFRIIHAVDPDQDDGLHRRQHHLQHLQLGRGPGQRRRRRHGAVGRSLLRLDHRLLRL